METLQIEEGSFVPWKILSVDIDYQLPALPCWGGLDSQEYTRALILVRLHKRPIGIVEMDFPKSGIVADELALRIWENLESSIQNHLIEDEILLQGRLERDGLNLSKPPNCLQKYHELEENAPLVSVVISTQDRVASLQECLRSILALNYPNYDVIVVDNAPSSNETADFIRVAFADSSKVRYIREDTPGLAVAHNRALAELEAPLVAFTDDDVLVDRNWLRFIVMNFQRDPMTGCVTGMILPYELESPSQLWIEQFGGFNKGFKRIVYDIRENCPKNYLFPYSAGQFGSGANMAFRTSALKSIGAFDPALGTGTLAKGGDDLAAFYDVITHGYRLVYEPGALLYHKHRRDYKGLSNQAYGYGVGLSAFLMRTIVKNPSRLIDVLLKIPYGLKYILDPRSQKNRKKAVDYPRELTLLELKGILRGSLAYLQSRCKQGR